VSREYPDRPFVGVGAVIVDESARVLLVKRRFEPLAGQWSLPGGAVDVGETLAACVIREMREETGLDVEVGAVIEVFDRIMHDAGGRVQYHYVLVDYVCRPVGGTPWPRLKICPGRPRICCRSRVVSAATISGVVVRKKGSRFP